MELRDRNNWQPWRLYRWTTNDSVLDHKESFFPKIIYNFGGRDPTVGSAE